MFRGCIVKLDEMFLTSALASDKKVKVISSLLEAEIDIKVNEEHPSYL